MKNWLRTAGLVWSATDWLVLLHCIEHSKLSPGWDGWMGWMDIRLTPPTTRAPLAVLINQWETSGSRYQFVFLWPLELSLYSIIIQAFLFFPFLPIEAIWAEPDHIPTRDCGNRDKRTNYWGSHEEFIGATEGLCQEWLNIWIYWKSRGPPIRGKRIGESCSWM